MKRRGFTLIELMVVIAIIIILAAIAIPNYLKMTERAKKSRLASDMATLATGLETFKTDWGSYPMTDVAATAIPTTWAAVDDTTDVFYDEVAGTDSGSATINHAPATNALGEDAPIEYLKPGTLASIIDPFKVATGATATQDDGHVYYSSNGTHWVLNAYIGSSTTEVYMSRTDSASATAATAGIPASY